MASNLNVTRENVLNLSNVDLKGFLASVGRKVSVSKTNRGEAEALAVAYFEEVTAKEGATVGSSLVTEYAGAFAFPKAVEAAFALVKFADNGDTEAYTGSDESTEEEGSDEESEEEAAARIEAEAAAESGNSGADTEKAKATRARARASNSAGVAASWLNADVRARRLIKDGVRVEGSDGFVGEFKSTKEAFITLRLPVEKHIKFRLNLKADKVNTIEKDGVKYVFTL